jgi:hypothetical protein
MVQQIYEQKINISGEAIDFINDLARRWDTSFSIPIRKMIALYQLIDGLGLHEEVSKLINEKIGLSKSPIKDQTLMEYLQKRFPEGFMWMGNGLAFVSCTNSLDSVDLSSMRLNHD